jgi:hypothetical protein
METDTTPNAEPPFGVFVWLNLNLTWEEHFVILHLVNNGRSKMNMRWVITQDSQGCPVVVGVEAVYIGLEWAVIILNKKECLIPVSGLFMSQDAADEFLSVSARKLGIQNN